MTLVDVIKFIALLSAALILGNWFLSEVKKSRSMGAPWYRPYLSPPGIIILIALLLPVIIGLLHR